MKLIRPNIIPLSLLLTVCGASSAKENSPDAFLTLPHDSKEGSFLYANKKQYRVKNVKLGKWAQSIHIISQNNFNSLYSINLKPMPYPIKGFRGLILKGRNFTLYSSGAGDNDGMLDSISFSADSKVASHVANEFKITLKKRKHPGYKLQT